MDASCSRCFLVLVTVAAVLTKTIATIQIFEPQQEEVVINEDRVRLKLKCKSDGTPIDWYKGNVELIQSDRVSIAKISGSNLAYNTLTIYGISVSDGGIYTCRNPDDAQEQDSVKITITPSAIRAQITTPPTTSTTSMSTKPTSPKVGLDVETVHGAASVPSSVLTVYLLLFKIIAYSFS